MWLKHGNKCCWNNWIEKISSNIYLIPYVKINMDHTFKQKIHDHINTRRKLGENFHDLDAYKGFLDKITQ